MKTANSLGLSMALAILFTGSAAYSQATPDIEGAIIQGGQIDDVIERNEETGRGILATESNEIDGEAGIYVLKLNEIFYINGSLGTGYSGNPLRTVDDVGGSFFVEGSASAGVQTRLDGKYDFGVRTGISGIEYGKDFAPSSRNWNTSINLGRAISGTPLYGSIAAFGGFNFDSGFGNGVGFYGLSVNLNAGFPLGPRTLVRPGIGLVRQWSEIGENNSTSASFSASLIHVLSQDLTLRANASVSRAWFDDFYEDVTFVSRKDWQYGGAVSLNYRLSDVVDLSASVGYEKKDSTFFLSNYNSFETVGAISAIARF